VFITIQFDIQCLHQQEIIPYVVVHVNLPAGPSSRGALIPSPEPGARRRLNGRGEKTIFLRWIVEKR
jgi:hypothetical protein